MKILYVVNTYDDKYINFYAVQVESETEQDFILFSMDKINIENYVQTFPKSLLNYELDMGYVTDKLDKDALKIQIDRIYDKLKKRIENSYQSSINLLNRCQEYKEPHREK